MTESNFAGLNPKFCPDPCQEELLLSKKFNGRSNLLSSGLKVNDHRMSNEKRRNLRHYMLRNLSYSRSQSRLNQVEPKPKLRFMHVQKRSF